MSRIDPHSCFDDSQPRTTAWSLRLRADFERKVLTGEVDLTLAAASGGAFDLDTKGLTIKAASVAGKPVPFELGPDEPILGRRLRLTLPAGTKTVTVAYETSPAAAGLQWLSPEQTAGKKSPFLFSQCQAIHARSVVPCQDSAAARVTYTAALDVPAGLTAVMSAGPDGDAPAEGGRHVFRFKMPQPIPSYLLALAVGELEGRDLSHRSRVWAEPAAVGAAAQEFSGVEEMIRAAESLFGPYDWDRFDMLVLPPSFPYGGMENPRMTFLTPTLLAGDKSLVDVVAHELAHSWTGNLVTNATAEHFWLNEGFTVWAERRILKALRGDEAAALSWGIGQKDMEEALERFAKTPELTCLRTHLKGVDPDDAFSVVPYEKGARFVVALERACGGEAAFDGFVKAYMKRFRFQSITTETFCAFVEEKFPGLLAAVDAPAWLDRPGLPAGAPTFVSKRLEELTALAQGWKDGKRPDAKTAKLAPSELLVYLQRLPREMPPVECAQLDAALSLNERGNYELLTQWLCIAAASGYEPAFPRIRVLLSTVGRMKYVRPLYQALGKTPAGRALAREVFAAAAPTYHALTRRAAESVMADYPKELAK